MQQEFAIINWPLKPIDLGIFESAIWGRRCCTKLFKIFILHFVSKRIGKCPFNHCNRREEDIPYTMEVILSGLSSLHSIVLDGY